MAELFWLNDTQWAAIAPLLPDLGANRASTIAEC